MTKRTRLFFFVAAGILVAGLGTGLVASYMGIQNLVLIGGDGPADLDYVPVDTRAVAYANVREVMDSELRKKILEFHPGQDVPDFTEETGIDIRTDVDEVLVALFGGQAEEDRAPVVLARGRFDTGRIESVLRQRGGTVEEYRGRRIVAGKSDGAPADGAVAFLEPGLVAAGTSASVRLAIDTKDAGQNIRSNDEVMTLVRSVDDGNAWTVARFDALTRQTRLPEELAKQLPAIAWLSASGTINGGLRAAVNAEARDEAAANDLRDVIRGFIALARIQVSQRAEFADLMNSIELGGQGKTVTLGFAVSPELIDAIAALHAMRPRTPEPQQAAPPEPGTVPAL